MSKIVWTPSKFDSEDVAVSVTVREIAEDGNQGVLRLC